jgi:type IV secretory pathway VirB10-like protein
MKTAVLRGCLLVNCIVFAVSGHAELLGRISDETAPVANPAERKAAKNNDRKIIYRVICSPEDKDLPDCDQSAVDDGSSAAELPMPDLPPDSEDALEKPESAKSVAPGESEKPERTQKTLSKKAARQKKSAKSDRNKKPAGKKHSHK